MATIDPSWPKAGRFGSRAAAEVNQRPGCQLEQARQNASGPREGDTIARMPPIQRALVSLSDKRGARELGRALTDRGIELISTGGTLRHLADAGIPVRAVSDVTGFPEIMDGRVKTLHPKIHGGLLADRDNPAHLAALADHEIGAIDLVVANLYPFRQTLATPGVARAEIIENIDIGGPAMVRAAAKNHLHVLVVVDPDDYPRVLAALSDPEGVVDQALRRELAAKAFRHTAEYDAAIARWLASDGEQTTADAPADAVETTYPPYLPIALDRTLLPRYGENPHQSAAVYALAESTPPRGVLGGMRQLQGKELSYNNLLDADAARKLVWLFDEPAVVIVKHNNPCGVGRGSDLVEAYRRAFEADPVSAFGSIVATNREVDVDLVAACADLFIEVLVAPAVSSGAAERLAQKRNLRVLICPPYTPKAGELELRGIDGGFLAQQPDGYDDDPTSWRCVTTRLPTAEEQDALTFAWRVARYVKSNAIVLANRWQTVGIGAGQMNRVDSCRLATGLVAPGGSAASGASRVYLPVVGTVAASDAFFPFRDGLEVLLTAGVSAIVQPGGSKRDDEVIAAANLAGAAMLFTGTRHFRH